MLSTSAGSWRLGRMERIVTDMRLMLRALFLISLLLAMAPAQALAEVKIVATLPALGQIVAAVAGEDGTVRVLARVGEDPHFVPPKPTLARHLAQADLLLTAGLALEGGWLPPLIELSRNSAIRQGQQGYFAGSDAVDVMGIMTEADRSMGDVHPEGNPHWWLDPLRTAKVAIALGQRLAKIDSAHAGDYQQRAEAFSEKLMRLVEQWKPKFEGAPPVVTYHDSYLYFTERFNIPVTGYIEPKPGVEPSPKHLDGLISTMKSSGVRQVWVEPYHHGRIVKRVASLSGAGVVVMPDAINGEGGDAYLTFVESLLSAAAGEAR